VKILASGFTCCVHKRRIAKKYCNQEFLLMEEGERLFMPFLCALITR